MTDALLSAAALIDRLLWGPWTMIFIAAVAVYLTVRSRFFQFRSTKLIIRSTIGTLFNKHTSSDKGCMTPFQATSTALASTVGMGNMAGVATALSVGGPGAIFWMWVLALLGMMTKTVEITLAVHYRDVDSRGNLRGGPMYYIQKGLGWTPLAKLFSIGILINAILTATLIQSHTVGRAFLQSYGWNPYLVTGAMAAVTGVVILGGVRRIGRFCEGMVPLMSLLYISAGLFLFFANAHLIPEVFSSIFRYAFSPAPAVGGFLGAGVAAALKNGMSKGMLSNEAGLGTAPMVHATADTSHPFRQGMWGALEVFIDTIVICTITAFAILSTGVLSSGQTGIELVITAFSSIFSPTLAGFLISIAILTFCLTTQIGFYIYYETAAVNVLGQRAAAWMKVIYLLPGIFFAGVADVDRLWNFANISVGVCAIPNLIAILSLSGVFFTLMRDYLTGENRYATSITDKTRNYVRSSFRRKNKRNKK